MFYVAPLFFAALLPLDRARRPAAALAPARRPASRRSRRAPAVPTLIGVTAPVGHARAPAVVVAPGARDRARPGALGRARRRAPPRRPAPLLVRGARCSRSRLVLVSTLARSQPIENGRHGVGWRRSARSSRGSRPAGATGSIAPSGATPTSPSSGRAATDAFTLWENEFFNRSVGPVYDLARRCPAGSAATASRSTRRRRPPRSGRPPVPPTYLLGDDSLPLEGRAVGSRPAEGQVLVMRRTARARVSGSRGSTRATRGRADVHLPAASAAAAARSRSQLVTDPASCSRGRSALRGERPHVARTRARTSRRRCSRAARSGRDGRCRLAFRVLANGPCRRTRARHGIRVRRPLPAVRLPPAVRIVYDVTPLSHPRTGVGNYIRGSLAGLAEAAGASTRSSRSRSPGRAARADPRGAGRGPGRAPAPALRSPGPGGRPVEPPRPASLSARGAVRRPPLRRLDVTRRSAPACARRRSTT